MTLIHQLSTPNLELKITDQTDNLVFLGQPSLASLSILQHFDTLSYSNIDIELLAAVVRGFWDTWAEP
uniref:Uncharacterized protein n=1 Tax=Moniliophthora roreri TaxID=221103 RepID=A0A0W0GFQ8_MONRR